MMRIWELQRRKASTRRMLLSRHQDAPEVPVPEEPFESEEFESEEE